MNVDDIAIDDISKHLEGVDSVIHSAAPLASRGDAEHIFSVSISEVARSFSQRLVYIREP